MTAVTLEEAQSHLGDLIARLRPGEEVVITRDSHPVARLVGEPAPGPQPRRLGTMRGTVVHVAPDFDAPLAEFKDYVP